MTRRRLVAAGAAVAILVGTVLGLTSEPPHPSGRIVDIEMRASAGTFAQLFWGADLGFSEDASIRIPVEHGIEGFQRLRFVLPAQEIRWIRFDPMDASGEVLIARMQLIGANGHVLKTFGAEDLRLPNQVAAIYQEGPRVRLVTTPGARDPLVQMTLGCGLPMSRSERFRFVTPLSLALVSIAAAALLGACTVLVFRDAFARRSAPEGVAAGDRRRTAAWMLMLFLVVLGAKLVLMREHPMTVPFWDQWDAEARWLYVPYSACGESWSRMFGLHNEHRVFFTRLLALDLLAINGQWDPRLEQVASALLHSLTAVLLAIMLWLANERRRLDLIAVPVALAFGLPFAWHNTLFGFQSAFYFLLLFSILGLWMTTRYAALSVPWSLGWICALCGIFSAAGGVLLPPAIALIAILKLWHEKRDWRQAAVALASAALVSIVGFAAASPPLAHHESLRAKTIQDFTLALGHNLAWPWITNAPFSVLMWLPLAVHLGGLVRRRSRTSAVDRFLIGLAAWVLLQALAIAYGRGAGGAVPGGRYEDFFSIGFIVNAVALGLTLRAGTADQTTARRLATAGALAWLAVAGIGMNVVVKAALIELNAAQRWWDIQTRNLREFVQTNDVAHFVQKRGPELPFPEPAVMVALLQDRYIRKILPASIRQPLQVESQTITNGAFVPEGTYPLVPRDPLARSWGSYSAEGNAAFGTFESQPLECQLGGHVLIEVSGYVGMTRETLAIRDVATGRQSFLRAPVWPREDWLRVVVRCPSHPFTVLASDARSDYWMAFREPVETGRVAPAAEWMIAASPTLLLVAFVFGVLAARQE